MKRQMAGASAFILCVFLLQSCWPLVAKDKRQSAPTPLDLYIQEAMQHGGAVRNQAAPGSLWTPAARFGTLGADLRAGNVDDIVTILVQDRASALASGNTKSERVSSANAGVAALGGITRAAGPLANLANLGSERSLEGEASTARQTLLSTTLSARVTHVLPNGYLVISGTKQVIINSESQLITVRGVVRPVDLSTGNFIESDRIAQLEVKVNGRGVVGDAIGRPSFLYRILLGLLPF